MRPAVVFGGVLVAALGAVSLWQGSLAGDERDLLGRELDERQRQIEKGRAARANREQLAEEIDNCQIELKRLARILPEALGVDAFLQKVNDLVPEHRVEVLVAEPRLVRRDFYDEAEIAIELEGDPADAAALIDQLRRSSRQVIAGEMEVEGRRTRVSLSIFGAAVSEVDPHFEVCELPTSRVVMPGLRGPVQAMRDELAVACAEAQAMAEEVEQVDRLESLRKAMLVKIQIINALESQNDRPPPTAEQLAADARLIAEVEAAAAEAEQATSPRP